MRKPNRVDWTECAGFSHGQRSQAVRLGTLPPCESLICKSAYCRGKGYSHPLVAEEELYEDP